jgi:hypothetical protein
MTDVSQLPAELQQLVKANGTPLTFLDGNEAYILLKIALEPLELGDGYRASMSDLSLVLGEGATKEETLIAFNEVMKATIQRR